MIETILAIGGGIVLLGNVGAVIYKFISPALNVRKEQEDQSRRLAALEEHEEKDLERLVKLQELSKLQMQILLVMINHMIDGNGIENMKKTRDDVQELLVRM